MADKNKYYYIKNYSSSGEMAISRHAFENIALMSIKNIKGVKPYKGNPKARSFNLYRPVTCDIRKDGRIDLNIDVSLKKNIDVRATCLKIQEEIRSALLLAVETVPFNININVASIDE